MRDLRVIVACGLLALCASWGASAQQDPRIDLRVTPYPDGNEATFTSSVTLSSSRYTTQVAYRVRLANNTTNTLNRVFYRASTTVTGAANNTSSIHSTPYVVSGAVGPCTQPDGPTSLVCPIGPIATGATGGTLLSNQGAEFWIVVTIPTEGSELRFTSIFGGDEGQGGGNGCCDTVLTRQTQLIDPVIASADPNARFKVEAFTFVGTPGATVFTGASGYPTADDPWSTTVSVPGVSSGIFGLPFTTASLRESLDLQSCSAINRLCNRSEVTVPGSFSHLTIVLRQHPSIIKPGSKIENWRIGYSHLPGVLPYTTLQSCSVSGGPSPGTPCLDSCQEYSSKTVPAVPKSLWGIFECTAKAIDNGGFRVE